MDYRELLREENEAVRERYDLSMERIAAVLEEEFAEPYGCYFKRTAALSATPCWWHRGPIF